MTKALIFVLDFLSLCVFCFSAPILEQLLLSASPCEEKCGNIFKEASLDLSNSCKEGCRLNTIIGTGEGSDDVNKTLDICASACAEAFFNNSLVLSCKRGCEEESSDALKKETTQTLHLLTPVIYAKSIYDTVIHHVKQFVSTSWTVYIQEDSGKMVVLQDRPKIIESFEYVGENMDNENAQEFSKKWKEDKLDWMDCLSYQSGLSRWVLIVMLSGFIIVMLWLCCVVAVTAPNQHIALSPRKNSGYVILCESDVSEKLMQAPAFYDDEAPPLPQKVSLI